MSRRDMALTRVPVTEDDGLGERQTFTAFGVLARGSKIWVEIRG
jgi:hypothetical protein